MAETIVELLDRSPSAGARLVALELLAAASDQAKAFLRSQSHADLHDFRTAVRRARTWLQAWRGQLGPEFERAEKKVAKLARATGPARDAHVQRKRLDAEVKALPGDLSAAEKAVTKELRRVERSSLTDAVDAARRFRTLEKTLRDDARTYGVALEPGSRPRPRFAHTAAEVLTELAEELLARLHRVRGEADERRLHKARIRAKRLRYVLEPIADYARDVEKLSTRLKSLTDLLGDIHDLHVWAAELSQLKTNDAQVAAGLVALQAHAQQEVARLYAQLARTWLHTGAPALGEDLRRFAAALAGGASRSSRNARAANRGVRVARHASVART